MRQFIDRVNQLAEECLGRGTPLEDVLIFTGELDRVLNLELEEIAGDVFANDTEFGFQPGKQYLECIVDSNGAVDKLLAAAQKEIKELRQQIADLKKKENNGPLQ